MKEALKSGLKTFLPTLLVIGGGWIFGILIANAFKWIYDKAGFTAAAILFFSFIFLFAWIINAYSDYKLQKTLKKIDEEHASLMKNLTKYKTK